MARALIGALVVLLGTAYDKQLWYASEEPRWVLLHLLVLSAASIYVFGSTGAGHRIQRRPSWPVRFALLFALTALLSIPDTFDILATWWSLKNVIACVGLFLLVVALRNQRWYWRLAWLFTLSMGFNGLLGALQFHGVDDQRVAALWPLWARFGPLIDYFGQAAVPGATFVNKNVAASYVVLTLPVSLAVFLGSSGRLPRLVAALCVTLGATLWIYARARSGWIGLVVALFLLVILVVQNNSVRALIRASFSPAHKLLTTVASTLLVLAVSLPSQVSADRQPRAIATQASTIFELHQLSYAVRWANDLNALSMALTHPVNGIGLGAFRAAYPLYHNAWVEPPSGAYDVTLRWDQLHNDWLQTFVELGVFGGLSLIGLVLSVAFTGWKVATEPGSQQTRLLGLSVLAGIAGLTIDSLANFPLQMPTAASLWCLAGCATGLRLLNVESGAPSRVSHPAIGPRMTLVLGVVLLSVLILVGRDDVLRWESGHHLKIALLLNRANADVYTAITEVDRAYELYPWNAKVQQARAWTYARDTRGVVASPQKITRVIEESLRYDPYSSYLLITVGKLYVYEAFFAPGRDYAHPDPAQAVKLAAVLDTLRRVESRRAEVPALAGYLALLRSHPREAAAKFEEAMKIDSTDPFVRNGVALTNRVTSDAKSSSTR